MNAAFLYYVPGHVQQSISPAEVSKYGLAYAFPAGTPSVCNAMPGAGPDGGAGAILTDGEDYRYNKDTQTWGQTASGWVGYTTAHPPGPDDLIRKKPLDGALLELADEREWLIPVGRRWSSEDDQARWSCALPSRLTFGQGGKVSLGRVLERYANLWRICEADSRIGTSAETELDRAVLGGNNIVFAAIEVLQANYRVSAAEVELLGLFTQDTALRIINIFGDWDAYRELSEKKTKQPATPPTSSGVAATPLSTVPPSQTA